jgi:hypothetical protein
MSRTPQAKQQPPIPQEVFGNQVQSLVSKTSDALFRLEKLEYSHKQLIESLCEVVDRVKSLEQHYLWLKETSSLTKKKIFKTKKK